MVCLFPLMDLYTIHSTNVLCNSLANKMHVMQNIKFHFVVNAHRYALPDYFREHVAHELVNLLSYLLMIQFFYIRR